MSSTNNNSWRHSILFILTACGTAATIYCELFVDKKPFLELPLWRWLLLITLIPPVWYLPSFVMFLIVMYLESRQALGGSGITVYLLVGVRVHAVRLVRCLTAELSVWALAYRGYMRGESLLLEVWTCASLFLGANLAKSLAAKAFSRHFHSASYFARMQDAVRKEYCLQAVARPHPLSTVTNSQHAAMHVVGRSPAVPGPGPVSGTGLSRSGREQKDGEGLPLLSAPGGSSDATARQGDGSGVGRGGSGPGYTSVPVAPDASVLVPYGATSAHSPNGVWARLQRSWKVTQQLNQAPPGNPPSENPAGGSRLSRQGSSSLTPFQSLQKPVGLSTFTSIGLQTPVSGSHTQDTSLERTHSMHTTTTNLPLRDTQVDGVQYYGTPFQRVQSASMQPNMLSAQHSMHDIQSGRPQDGIARLSARGASPAAAGTPPVGAAGVWGLSSLLWLEQHIRVNKLKLSLTEQLGKVADGDEVDSSAEAARVAEQLFLNILGGVGGHSRSYFEKDQLRVFFNNPSEVDDAFALLDVDGDGQVTLENMSHAVMGVYQERKKLALTLQDTKSVVGKLELICGVILHLICIGIYLAIFNVSIKELWLTISSFLLGFVFIFGNSIRGLYESVVFLFVVHPFDVGDHLLRANGETVKVEEIALMITTFSRVDGRRMYYPNSRLMQEELVNISRSDRLFDSVILVLDASTVPPSLLDKIEESLKSFAALHPREFTGAASVNVKGVELGNKLILSVRWQYTHSGEEASLTNCWRSRVLMALVSTLEGEGATYSMPAQPQYSATLTARTQHGGGAVGDTAIPAHRDC